MSQKNQEANEMLGHIFTMLQIKSGASIRGIMRQAHMGEANVKACLRGETNQFSPTSAYLQR